MRIDVYKPTAWVPFIFKFHRENIFRRLRPVVYCMVVYAVIVASAEYYLYDDYGELIDEFSSLGQFHLLFNFVLSVMIAFRVNTAYSRWWEGRGLWGQLTNSTRNLALRFESFIGLNAEPQFKSCLALFPVLLKHHLRREIHQVAAVLNELGLSYREEDHLPTVFLSNMNRLLTSYRKHQQLSLEQFLVLSNQLEILTDVMGGCEKIKNTPVPVPFNILIKQALFFYMLIFPFGWVGTFGLFVVPMLMVMIYVLLGLEVLADEMEDPFSLDDNDLPLDKICATIAESVNTIAYSADLVR